VNQATHPSASRETLHASMREAARMRFPVAAVVLAAGRSSRMGNDHKLTLQWRERTLLEHTLSAVDDAAFSTRVVVSGPHSTAVRSLAADFVANRDAHSAGEQRWIHVDNPRAALGMLTSIQTGIQCLDQNRVSCAGYMICLADQPLITSAIYDRLLTEFWSYDGRRIIVPLVDGIRGNPVVIPAHFRPEILGASASDRGCAFLLARHPEMVAAVELRARAVAFDVDTPADFAALKNEQPA